ncbi:MAG: hypothetical protein ACAH80_17155 [Alphaproteobacteria bacterium]
MQKVLSLGEIDRWLRGLVHLVPKHEKNQPQQQMQTEGMEVEFLDVNTHIMPYDTPLIENEDIERMHGFRQLVAACSQANVKVDMALPGHSAVQVVFEPAEAFSRSMIFGTTYANVLPVMFGAKNRPGRKK